LNGRDSFIVNEKYHFDDRIKEFEKHLKELRKGIPSNIAVLTTQYISILKGSPDSKTFEQLLSGTGLKELVDSKKLSREQFLEIIKASSYCTVCPSSILTDGMEKARLEVEQLAIQQNFEYVPPRGSVEFEEWAILQCMFKHAQNIALYWFQHHQTNAQFWDKFFPKDFQFDRKKEDTKAIPPVMYPYTTRLPVTEWDKHHEVNVEWSDTELKRVFERDIRQLHALQTHLREVQSRKAENDYRKTINEKDSKRTSERISELEKKIRAKLKTSMYITRPHEAGYDIDVAHSVDKNFQKLDSLKD